MKNYLLLGLALGLPATLLAQDLKVVTNHVGYDLRADKKAVIVATTALPGTVSFQVMDEKEHAVYSGTAKAQGVVNK